VKLQNLTQKELLDFPSFTLKGLQCDARITRIIDGDTVELFFEKPCVVSSTTVHIPVKFVCRLEGIDCAEKKIEAGKRIISMIEKVYAATNNIVWASFNGPDKYGRQLATLFTNSSKTRSFNDILLEYVDPVFGHTTTPYSGGTRIKS
jgi:endonuclease YncB( thermonuclease family)